MTAPSLLTGLTQAMKHLSERQRVKAQNIANSDTPGFKAKELAAPDFGQLLESGGAGSPRVARPRIPVSSEMARLGARGPADPSVILDRDVSETKPDGNNVTLEDQLLKMGQIQTDFTTLTNLYRKQMALLKTAIGRNG